MLNATQDVAGQSDSFRQFEGGVKLGIGSFNLVSFFFNPQESVNVSKFNAGLMCHN